MTITITDERMILEADGAVIADATAHADGRWDSL